jgi:hypothetical protein
MMAVICPFSSSCRDISIGWVMTFRLDFSISFVYNSFLLEDAGSKVTLMTGVVELRNPNTRMKMMGNAKLKMTAEGLLKIDFKLAFAMASIALH